MIMPAGEDAVTSISRIDLRECFGKAEDKQRLAFSRPPIKPPPTFGIDGGSDKLKEVSGPLTFNETVKRAK